MTTSEILIEGITQDIIAYLVEDRNIKISQALDIFYNSIVYEKLKNPESGLYMESSAYVYELLKDVLMDGYLQQKEQ